MGIVWEGRVKAESPHLGGDDVARAREQQVGVAVCWAHTGGQQQAERESSGEGGAQHGVAVSVKWWCKVGCVGWAAVVDVVVFAAVWGGYRRRAALQMERHQLLHAGRRRARAGERGLCHREW